MRLQVQVPQIYPSPNTELWLGSSTASYPDVRADRVGGARPLGEVRDGRVGTTDDPKAPEPQLMPPSVSGGVHLNPYDRAGGRRKHHESSHV